MHAVLPIRRVAPSVIAFVVVASGLAAGSTPALAAAPTLKWERQFPGVVVRGSSMLPVELDGSGTSVMYGGYDGKVYALHGSDGSNVPGWPQQTSHAIESSPAAADVNGDGTQEVFIGSGTAAVGGGAMYSFDRAGGTRFRFNGRDADTPSQAMHSTPALGDINRDGSPDATFGALGLTMWSLNPGGGVNSGWPFYTDDTVFSSAALTDVNDDGTTDVVIGGDSSPGGPVDHCGGLVRAITGTGQQLWRFLTDEIVYSSPAVGDIDGDGREEIVFGTGDYYAREFSRTGCPRPVDSTKVFALNQNGSLKWARETGGITLGSPALADLNGDGRLDVVLGTAGGGNPGKVWAWDGGGNTIPGFQGRDSSGGAVIGSVTTADLNGDGGQDVLVPTGGGVFAFSGKGGAPLFGLAQGQMAFQNSPLVMDIDGNGLLDILVVGTTPQNTAVARRYEMAASDQAVSGALGWPMFRKDPRRTGSWTGAPLSQTPTNFCAQGAGGYWLVAADGGIFSFCDAGFFGSTGAIRLNQPIRGMASTPSGNGYWLVAADGGIFAFGDARFFGSTGAIRLNQPIVGMARTPSGNGYWLVAADGGIFAFGDARFFGSTGAIRLNQPIRGMASTPSGNGYWLVAADGGIFAFGDAVFRGSTGAIRLNQPIVTMSSTPSGNGYLLAAADGGIFAFGDAAFRGSTGAIRLNQPIVGMSRDAAGTGYWLVASDGGIFAFGVPFFGSTGAIRLNQPMVGMGVR